MNLMMRRKHWFRRFGIVRFLDPMIRIYRAAFRHFHLLLERRKSKEEQVTQWMIRQTNRHANKELLSAPSSPSMVAKLPSTRQIASLAQLVDERLAPCGRLGASVCSKRSRDGKTSFGFAQSLNDAVRDCLDGRSS